MIRHRLCDTLRGNNTAKNAYKYENSQLTMEDYAAFGPARKQPFFKQANSKKVTQKVAMNWRSVRIIGEVKTRS